MKQSSTPIDFEEHVRRVREEGELRILASSILQRCVALSEDPDPLFQPTDVSRYKTRHSGFSFLHLARALAQRQNV